MYLRAFQLEITSLLITEILDVLCYSLLIEPNLWDTANWCYFCRELIQFCLHLWRVELGKFWPPLFSCENPNLLSPARNLNIKNKFSYTSQFI